MIAVLIGATLIVIGFLWHVPALTRTEGVIVESQRIAGGTSARDITYEYVVNGVRYRGRRFLSYAAHFEGAYDVGHSFTVFYPPSHPETSYGPNLPRQNALPVLGGCILAFAALVTFGTRRLRQL